MTFQTEPDHVTRARQALVAHNFGSGDLANHVLEAVSANCPYNFFAEGWRISTTLCGTVQFEPLDSSCDN